MYFDHTISRNVSKGKKNLKVYDAWRTVIAGEIMIIAVGEK